VPDTSYTNSIKRFFVVFLFVISCGPVWGQGKKPPEKQPAEKPSHTLKDANDDANKALNDMDRGIHKALPAAKKGANDALESIDRGVHKILEPEKKH
jgi:hypothetical protein